MISSPKRFDPKSRWVKYQDGLWIQSRKRVFLYWYKFLQHAEKSEDFTVNWDRYVGWGDPKYVLSTKFDDFWNENWQTLFGVKNEGDVSLFPLSTKQPKADGLRYALLVYENLHSGSNWDIAIAIAKREQTQRGVVGSSFFYAREDVESGKEDRMIIQSRVGRYKKAAKKHLENVCEGQFP
jgi:hypothetical protein